VFIGYGCFSFLPITLAGMSLSAKYAPAPPAPLQNKTGLTFWLKRYMCIINKYRVLTIHAGKDILCILHLIHYQAVDSVVKRCIRRVCTLIPVDSVPVCG
jgi:hypothetical protein